MIPVIFVVYGAIAALAACLGCWGWGDAHGHNTQKATDQAAINTTIIAATKVADDNEQHQRKENATQGASYAASAAVITVAASSVDTRLRVATCHVNLPEAAASRPAIDAAGTAGTGAVGSEIDLDDVAQQIVRAGAERDRLAAKVNALQGTIKAQPGYTDGN